MEKAVEKKGDALSRLLQVANVDESLKSRLLAQPREVAKEHGVPAYTVFHDSTLQEIAQRLPSSLDGLREISGIGATKLERYGEPLLRVVRECAGGVG